MSIIVNEENKVYEWEDISKIIHDTTEFDIVKDISDRTKREDVLAFILQCDTESLKNELKEETDISIEENEEEYISELMNKADEYAVEIEESLPEDLLAYYYAYEYDEDQEIIKSILVVAFEELGERKLKDIGNRMITVVGD
ncbi:hypothetical protein [Anaerophilus nitritogenes]|uniref:hypothetical protein n=1 Tax=Anaerophilus nitritogenes TaxID=2498136 RepID=UPI00101C2405|nr:hypothetical protein [Anaerophilus nitritogenes]